MEIKIKKLNEKAVMPQMSREGDAGFDLCALEGADIAPGQSVFVGTGIAMAIPEGYFGAVYARSGISCKRGLAPANKVGVIDSNYRGEIIICLHNHSDKPERIEAGDKIAQMVIQKHETPVLVAVEDLDETNRGAGGFGSSGDRF